MREGTDSWRPRTGRSFKRQEGRITFLLLLQLASPTPGFCHPQPLGPGNTGKRPGTTYYVREEDAVTLSYQGLQGTPAPLVSWFESHGRKNTATWGVEQNV